MVNLFNKYCKTIVYITFGITLTACSTFSDTLNEGQLSSLQPAKLYTLLPDNCPTPDAFAIAPDNSLTLSCPNYANSEAPGVLIKLHKDGNTSLIGVIPSSEGVNNSSPMGIAYAPDGSLFVADNQGLNKGRLLRVSFIDGKISRVETVAKGLSSPNGVRYYKGNIYLTQLRLPKIKSKNITSGLYRFSQNDRNISVSSDGSSKHLIFSTETKNPDSQFGLDGLVFDKKGNLFIGNLGDSTIYKLHLGEQGDLLRSEVYAVLPLGTGPDGIDIDNQGNLYVAGFPTNKIIKITPNRDILTLAEYPDNDGSNGEIDQPADLIVYDEKLVISNFDLLKGKGIVNKGHSKPFTLSVIDL